MVVILISKNLKDERLGKEIIFKDKGLVVKIVEYINHSNITIHVSDINGKFLYSKKTNYEAVINGKIGIHPRPSDRIGEIVHDKKFPVYGVISGYRNSGDIDIELYNDNDLFLYTLYNKNYGNFKMAKFSANKFTEFGICFKNSFNANKDHKYLYRTFIHHLSWIYFPKKDKHLSTKYAKCVWCDEWKNLDNFMDDAINKLDYYKKKGDK